MKKTKNRNIWKLIAILSLCINICICMMLAPKVFDKIKGKIEITNVMSRPTV